MSRSRFRRWTTRRAGPARLDRHRVRDPHRAGSDLRLALPCMGRLDRRWELRWWIRHLDDPTAPGSTAGRRERSGALIGATGRRNRGSPLVGGRERRHAFRLRARTTAAGHQRDPRDAERRRIIAPGFARTLGAAVSCWSCVCGDAARSRMGGVGRLDHGMPCQICGTNQPRIITKAGKHQPGLLAEASPCQSPAEGLAVRVQEQIASSAHAPADDNHLRIHSSGDVGDSPPEPRPDIGQQLHRGGFALNRCCGDSRSADLVRIAAHHLQEPVGRR